MVRVRKQKKEAASDLWNCRRRRNTECPQWFPCRKFISSKFLPAPHENLWIRLKASKTALYLFTSTTSSSSRNIYIFLSFVVVAFPRQFITMKGKKHNKSHLLKLSLHYVAFCVYWLIFHYFSSSPHWIRQRAFSLKVMA